MGILRRGPEETSQWKCEVEAGLSRGLGWAVGCVKRRAGSCEVGDVDQEKRNVFCQPASLHGASTY